MGTGPTARSHIDRCGVNVIVAAYDAWAAKLIAWRTLRKTHHAVYSRSEKQEEM